MKRAAQAAKAIFAFVVAGLGSLTVVMVDDTSVGDITDGQWASAVLVALIAGGGVYGISNAPKS